MQQMYVVRIGSGEDDSETDRTPLRVSQKASIPTAASELQSLLAVPALAGVPLLVVSYPFQR